MDNERRQLKNLINENGEEITAMKKRLGIQKKLIDSLKLEKD